MTRKQQYSTSAIVFACFPPLMILAHEVGHYSVSRFLGYHPQFRYAEIFIPISQGVSNSDWLWITLAGPLVEGTMTVIGLSWLFRNYRMGPREYGSPLWIFTALSLAGLRWVKVIFDGRGSDEAWLSATAGWHYLTLPILLLPIAILSGGAVFCFHRKQQTLLPLAAGFCAGLVSVALWFTVVGPALLPYPDANQQGESIPRQDVGGRTATGQFDSGPRPIEATGQPLTKPLTVDLIGKRVQVQWTGRTSPNGKTIGKSWWLAVVTDVFPEDGTLGVHYVGWSEEWDEIVPASRVITDPGEG